MRTGRYRLNIGAILIQRGCVWMGEHASHKGLWQFPQGGQEPGETQQETLWRELHEELGLTRPEDVCEILAVGPPVRYDFHDDNPSPVARIYQGQEQTLFVLAFTGTDEDIDLQAFHEPEFTQYKWVPISDVARTIWPLKRHICEATQRACSELQEQ